MIEADKKHSDLCCEAATRRRVKGVLVQFANESVAEALVDEVLARISELPCRPECEASGHLDIVYCLAFDMVIEYWQEAREERLKAWDVVPSAVELKTWFKG